MSIQSNFPNLKPSLLLDFANTKQLDNRVTFTRSTPAVYYDGKTTAMAEQNLVTYSQAFNNAAWSIIGSVTANATTAPDGTSTATKLTETTANGAQLVYQSFTATAQPYTFSCYMKAAERTWGALRVDAGTNEFVYFDLTNGVVGNIATGYTATITSVGSGWYRCTVTRTLTAASWYACVDVAQSNGTGLYAGTIGYGIYIWGAQLEQRSAATAYTATTTQAITNYIPVLLTAGGNQPRFDCNPTTGESLGLLIEEQRTNVFFSSEGNTSWSTDGTGSVLLDSATINPAGQAGGWIYKNAGYAYLNWGNGVSAGTWTYSVYIKKSLFNTTNVGRVSMFTPSVAVDYNFGTGVITLQSGSPVSYGCQRLSDTMARVWITVTITGATLGIGAFDNSINSTLLWGLQIESGSFPTSYIKTVSASTTRTADAASMTGANFTSWYSNNIGTIYASLSVPSSLNVFSNSAATLFSMGSGRVTTRITNTGNAAAVLDQVGGLISTANSVNLNAENKTATSFSQGNYSICLNNGTVVSYSSSTIVQPATQLLIGFDAYDNRPNTPIRKIAYYPSVLTNAQLQALTS